MEAPKPKQDIIVRETSHPGGHEAFCMTEESANWIKEQAPQFGSCDEFTNSARPYFMFSLFILPNYDRDEVIAYLERRDPPTPLEDHIPLRVPQVGDKVRFMGEDNNLITGYIGADDGNFWRIDDAPNGNMVAVRHQKSEPIQVIERAPVTPNKE